MFHISSAARFRQLNVFYQPFKLNFKRFYTRLPEFQLKKSCFDATHLPLRYSASKKTERKV